MIDPRKFISSTLEDVKLNEFSLTMCFLAGKLDIVEYWECFDEEGKQIDRYLSSKFRKNFRLSELINKTLLRVEKEVISVVLIFSNEWKLKIIMEFWPYGLKNMGTEALDLLGKIEDYGFGIGLIDENNKHISSLPSEKIVEMCINSGNGRGFVNLLLEK